MAPKVKSSVIDNRKTIGALRDSKPRDQKTVEK
jgi:hypothetical protein